MKFFSLLSLLILSIFLLNGTSAGPIKDLISWAKNAGTLNNKMTTASNVRYGPRDKDMVDVYYNKLDTETLKPAVIFVHGGGWIQGDKYNFIEIGAALARNGYVAFLPNYTLFPEGNIEDMVDDLHRMIRWVWYYGDYYGGDRDRITVVGYSAGAHITALTFVKTALKMVNQNEVLGILPRVEKVVLFSGPYNLSEYDQIRKMLDDNNAEKGITQKVLSGLFNSKDISPTCILRDHVPEGVTNIDLYTPKFVFYYSDKDTVVPPESANDFMKEIRRVSPATEIVYHYDQGDGSTHETLMIGARDAEEKYQRAFFKIIRS